MHGECLLPFDAAFRLSVTKAFHSSPLGAKVQLENTLGAFSPFECTRTHVLRAPTPATPQKPHVSLSYKACGVRADFVHTRTTELSQ